MSWWYEFEDRSSACVGVGPIDEADAIAESAGTVIAAYVLPYAAAPRLDKDRDGMGPGQEPSFCRQPEKCKGRTTCPCPNGRACND